MTHGSLFSGMGGFDLAAEWMGWENVFHCEWNEFGQKILKYYWPKSISYGDITKTNFTIHRGKIDVLTGGFPCQPYSAAGQRKGKEDDRHLWPEMLRAIREIRPRWVVGENVLGLVNWGGGLVFHEVQTDLEAEGYEVFPYVLPSCGKNAPHRRDRIWFVAYATGSRYENREESDGNGQKEQSAIIGTSERGYAADTEICSSKRELLGRSWETESGGLHCSEHIAADTVSAGGGETVRVGHGESNVPHKIGAPGTWDEFPTQPPVCSRNDGLSPKLDGITFSKWRNESIKAAGNAIVPQVVYEIFKAIGLYELDRAQTLNPKKS